MLDKKRIVLFGAGPHGQVVADIISNVDQFEIAGFIDSTMKPGEECCGIRVLGDTNDLKELERKHVFRTGVVCVGDNYSRSNWVRSIMKIDPDFEFPNVIHPFSSISNTAQLGCGNVFMPGVIINRGATVGDHCIINTNSSLEHYCSMANYSSISAGVTTGGFVSIGEYSALALGVTVFDRISIGKNVVVGSGSLVTKDLDDNVLAYGSPAKVVRKRQLGEKFLK